MIIKIKLSGGCIVFEFGEKSFVFEPDTFYEVTEGFLDKIDLQFFMVSDSNDNKVVSENWHVEDLLKSSKKYLSEFDKVLNGDVDQTQKESEDIHRKIVSLQRAEPRTPHVAFEMSGYISKLKVRERMIQERLNSLIQKGAGIRQEISASQTMINDSKEFPLLSQFGAEMVQIVSAEFTKGTGDIYDAAFARFTKFVGDIPINDVTSKQIENFKVSLRERKLSPVTINIALKSLQAAFNRAIILYDLPSNPFLRVKKFREIQKETNVFTREELGKIMQIVKEDWLKDAIILAGTSGMRIGEICHLMWSQIDLDRGILSVEKSEGFSPKFGKPRTVVLSPLAIEMFRRRMERRDPNCKYVFEQIGKRITSDWMRKRFKHYLRIAISPIDERYFHILRHTFGTLAGDESLIKTQKQLGHSDIKTTMQYVHVNTEELRSVVAVADQLFFPEPACVKEPIPSAKSPSFGSEEKTLMYLPENLDLRALLIKNNRIDELKHLQRYYYFVHRVYSRSIDQFDEELMKKVHRIEPVSLNRKSLSAIVGKEIFGRIKQTLIDLKILVTDNHYKAGEKSIGFSLTDEYSHSLFKSEEITDAKILKQLNKKEPSGGDLYGLKHHFDKLKIDQEEALNYCEKLLRDQFICPEQYRHYKFGIDRIAKRQLSIRRDTKGMRAHSNLTNLSKKIRPFLKVDGFNLCKIDIKNCQPLLLNIWLFKNEKNQHLPFYKQYILPYESENSDSYSEFLEFKEGAESGKIYEILMEKINKTEIIEPYADRGEFKLEVFKKVFFPHLNPDYEFAFQKAFKKVFPHVYDAIVCFKSNEYRNLAYALQRAESYLMIDCICKHLNNVNQELFIATIHDCICTLPEGVELVSKTIKEQFLKNYGLHTTLDIEYLKEPVVDKCVNLSQNIKDDVLNQDYSEKEG